MPACTTPGTRADLAANPIFGVLDPTLVIPRDITLHKPFEPLPGLQVTAYPVPGKVALYLEGAAPDTRMLGEQTIGLRIEAKDRVFHYIPGCAEVTDDLVARLSDADLLFFDGTVWRDDEMPATGTGAKTGARFYHAGPEVTVFMRGAHRFAVPDALDRAGDEAGSDLTLAPMPGLVKAVFVAAGQAVQAGERLAIMEAMKMEHTMLAARDGIVAEVLVAEGAQVEAGDALIRLQEEEDA